MVAAFVGPVARQGNILPNGRSERERERFGVRRKIRRTCFIGIRLGVIVNIDVPVVTQKVGCVEEQVDCLSAHYGNCWSRTGVVPARAWADSVAVQPDVHVAAGWGRGRGSRFGVGRDADHRH